MAEQKWIRTPNKLISASWVNEFYIKRSKGGATLYAQFGQSEKRIVVFSGKVARCEAELQKIHKGLGASIEIPQD